MAGKLGSPQITTKEPALKINPTSLKAEKKMGRKIEGNEPLDQKVTINFSLTEKAMLDKQCDKLGGLAVTKLIRSALKSQGLI